ncbi:DNA polymerase IV [Belliella aquatica]|uniref:DNA polymerase IV n=1 Tax=Belliella aquatica TaxID=1323734 RepID=A0ABQ1MH74_9BACT|nr:DNA polymerase IV [Belliella aquatica]MCH7405201.1 DNA polymerase IV [Belliella aquatica]GGC38949.1 DNA polymerase IV 2 [Belliella aquatica]
MDNIRKIIHVDMDAFYASVEQLDNPDLVGKPVAVGGNRERGVVAAASYEARKYGVRSAMSGKMAALKCPHLIFVRPRFERYKEISNQIREIFFEYTDLVEPLSLDEAFLDVTENKFQNPSATLLAKEIREKIKLKTGLNASAGISYNKFLAKTASDINKPNGQAVILPKEAEAFLEKLPIEKFFGIGKVTAEKMKKFGIHQGKDLKEYSLQFLTKKFGKSGLHFYNIVRGIHMSEVQPNRERKSISAENTFEKDLPTQAEWEDALKGVFEELMRRIEKTGIKGRTITLKIKYKDFTLQTRSKSFDQYPDKEKIWETVLELLNQERLTDAVRLFGIGISNLNLLEEKIHFGKQLWFEFEDF